MRVLWISCTMFPEASIELGNKPLVFDYWQSSTAQALLDNREDLELAVASLTPFSDLKIIDKYRIKYYLIPWGLDNQYYYEEKRVAYERVIKDFMPDLVHIHGSEYPHTLAAAHACGNVPFIVSIQGMVSSICDYYNAGLDDSIIAEPLPLKVVIKEKIKKLLGRSPLRTLKEEMQIRGEYEKQLFSRAKHVFGRTSWDKAHTWAINKDICYHFCNETLRPAFYSVKWKYEDCVKHTVFLSQGNYPLKGLHRMIEAIPLILRQFPDTKVFIGGRDIVNDATYNKSGYALYISKLIAKHNLNHVITFLGQLDENQMAEQYAKANVFVSPSSIENSPLSVGEAQLVGTPCIGSYVGGTMDMIEHDKTGLLFRFEETCVLAKEVCMLFGSKELCERLSSGGHNAAVKRHDRAANARRTLEIYDAIIRNKYAR